MLRVKAVNYVFFFQKSLFLSLLWFLKYVSSLTQVFSAVLAVYFDLHVLYLNTFFSELGKFSEANELRLT